MTTETINNSASELSSLISRAKRVSYKNFPPRLPKKPTPSTMMGFEKRLKNWTAGLQMLEVEYARQAKHIVVANNNLLENYIKK